LIKVHFKGGKRRPVPREQNHPAKGNSRESEKRIKTLKYACFPANGRERGLKKEGSIKKKKIRKIINKKPGNHCRSPYVAVERQSQPKTADSK